MKIYLFLALIILCGFQSDTFSRLTIYQPSLQQKDDIIEHKGFTLNYSEEHEQAKWVMYELKDSELRNTLEREGNFIVDPLVKTGSASPNDYLSTGYDRGHLAPAADMEYDKTVLHECFYMSNMSPQKPGFNRGIWKKLEGQVRSWGLKYGDLIIVVGPILEPNLPKIGTVNKVSVPNKFYKIIYDIKRQTVIGFIMENKGSNNKVSSFVVTVDEIEKETGIDFFPSFDDTFEEKIESELFLNQWQFDN